MPSITPSPKLWPSLIFWPLSQFITSSEAVTQIQSISHSLQDVLVLQMIKDHCGINHGRENGGRRNDDTIELLPVKHSVIERVGLKSQNNQAGN